MQFDNIDKLKSLLIEHEGLRLKPYKCTAGKTTIGVGRNLDDNGITEDEAMFLLDNDIRGCIKDLRYNLTFFEELDEERQIVLIDMCFNMGINRLLKFQNTLGLIKEKCYNEAADEMLKSAWAVQVGKRAGELSEIMRSGKL